MARIASISISFGWARGPGDPYFLRATSTKRTRKDSFVDLTVKILFMPQSLLYRMDINSAEILHLIAKSPTNAILLPKNLM